MRFFALEQARRWVIEHLDDGVVCPCCGQLARRQRRKVTSSMVYMLGKMYQTAGTDYVHLHSLRDPRSSMDTTVMKYWGLIAEDDRRREDGGRGGYWRVTHFGERFLQGKATISKYAWVFNDAVHRYEGPNVNIHDCNRERFRFDELMAA